MNDPQPRPEKDSAYRLQRWTSGVVGCVCLAAGPLMLWDGEAKMGIGVLAFGAANLAAFPDTSQVPKIKIITTALYGVSCIMMGWAQVDEGRLWLAAPGVGVGLLCLCLVPFAIARARSRQRQHRIVDSPG